MRRTVGIAAGIIGAAALVAAASSCGSSSTGPKLKTYVANLSPANEVPAKTTTGTGVATFVDNGDFISWTLSLTNMTGVVASHIHGPAAAGVNAAVIINLFLPNVATGTLNGVVMSGTITNANNANVSLDSLRTLFNNGNAYVNVHTSVNPGGEIRDQVHPSN
ncbi:MAG TPA: CHRD domain-containing protein [Gemmatimonadaceae bacterium]